MHAEELLKGFLSDKEAKLVLEDAEHRLSEFLDARKRTVYYHGQKGSFGREYVLEPQGVTDTQWESFYRELCDTVRSIASAVNTERRLSDRCALQSRVLGEPVSRWQGSLLSTDLHTGTVPSGKKLNELKASFYVPHEIPYR